MRKMYLAWAAASIISLAAASVFAYGPGSVRGGYSKGTCNGGYSKGTYTGGYSKGTFQSGYSRGDVLPGGYAKGTTAYGYSAGTAFLQRYTAGGAGAAVQGFYGQDMFSFYSESIDVTGGFGQYRPGTGYDYMADYGVYTP